MSGLARSHRIIIVTNITTHRYTGPMGGSLFEWPNQPKSHKKGGSTRTLYAYRVIICVTIMPVCDMASPLIPQLSKSDLVGPSECPFVDNPFN